MIEARILEIERFALKDGPGIRTVVFFKGCTLHCPWCSNPESQACGRELMHRGDLCRRCGLCASVCPCGCISFKPGGLPLIDRQGCDVCGLCADACPAGAFRIVPSVVPCDEIMSTILRDSAYYSNSGGGVTLSGGEALLQEEAALYILRECKARGIHTALETSGNVPPEALQAAAPYTDLFLFDIKQLDADKLHSVTGGDLALILGNLRSLPSGKVRLRVPCIPGFNDDDSFREKLQRLACETGAVSIDYLPFHELGSGKYAQLGRDYTFMR